MTKIRSCPFCGYTGALLRSDDSGFYVYCEGCSTYGPRKNNSQAAIDQWNNWHCEAQVLMFNEMGFSKDQYCEYTRRLILNDGTHKEVAEEVLKEFLNRESKKEDNKINPSHYSRWQIEPLDFISANNLDFLRGNIIKYIMRYDAKGGMEDLKKAQVYLDKLIEKNKKE